MVFWKYANFRVFQKTQRFILSQGGQDWNALFVFAHFLEDSVKLSFAHSDWSINL